MKNRLSFKSF